VSAADSALGVADLETLIGKLLTRPSPKYYL